MGLSVQQTHQQEPFKMKLLILAVVLSAAWAAPSSQQLESVQPVAIVSSRSEINQDGSYSYAFESGNGIKVEKRIAEAGGRQSRRSGNRIQRKLLLHHGRRCRTHRQLGGRRKRIPSQRRPSAHAPS